MIYYLLIASFFWFSLPASEIIRDQYGNYYIMKNDGTFKKLPPPKAGMKYVIKKKSVVKKKSQKNSIFKRVEKKSRVKSNQGIR